jgi:hypothetical protein
MSPFLRPAPNRNVPFSSATTNTSDPQNQIKTVTRPSGDGANVAYDKNGNVTTDENGNKFIYNAWNQPVSIKSATRAQLALYSYDAPPQIPITIGTAISRTTKISSSHKNTNTML